MIDCYSKCLYCGRRTPHEVCHDHSEAMNPGWFDAIGDVDAVWGTGYDKESETCEDPACPVWGPGEWDRIQKRRESEALR